MCMVYLQRSAPRTRLATRQPPIKVLVGCNIRSESYSGKDKHTDDNAIWSTGKHALDDESQCNCIKGHNDDRSASLSKVLHLDLCELQSVVPVSQQWVRIFICTGVRILINMGCLGVISRLCIELTWLIRKQKLLRSL